MQTITINPLSPQALVMRCTPSDALQNMTEVASSVIRIKKPDGTIITLTTTGTASESLLTLVHPFVLGDADQVGIYKVRPQHTLIDGRGPIKGKVQSFQVTDDGGL